MNSIIPHVKKIAILRANALGDFIFALPAISAIRDTYPAAEIVYLGKPWHKEFIKHRPTPIDRVIIIPVSRGVREENNREENQQDLYNFFSAMRMEQFDIAVQIHGGGRNSNPFLRKLGAKLTVGLKTPDAIPLDISIPYIYYQNEILRYLEVAAAIGAKTTAIEPQVSLAQNDINEAKNVLGDTYAHPFAVIHPGATDIRRQWPPEKFAYIADILKRKGMQIVITGTIAEKQLIDNILLHMQEQAINLCGRISISGLTGVLSRANIVIANDTGPLHLARALNTPTVGIYWCGNLINGGPMTQTLHRPILSWAIYCPMCGEDCASIFPFNREKTLCKHAVSFVANIAPDEVLEQTADLLSSNFQKEKNTLPHLYE